MKKPMRILLTLASCAIVAALLPGCGQAPSVPVVLAPPGPADLGPATGLSTPPADAVVVDLKYRAQTGATDDVQSYSFWGFGGANEEARTNSFLRDVRTRVSRPEVVHNPMFKGREWAAVEYHGRQATALYFDLDGNGKLSENERIAPSRTTGQGVDFITPDFMNAKGTDSPALCRALLRVDFYEGNSEPNTMWSPAANMEGSATVNGKPARLLLFANGPGGRFDEYGSSSYSFLRNDQPAGQPNQYIPRETLSSLIVSEGQFYHLTIDGKRANGLPARALLVKDTTPTGGLAIRLTGSNSLSSRLSNLYVQGVEDKTVVFRTDGTREKLSLPEGAYALNNGTIAYGTSNALTWEMSFSKGPQATVKAGETVQVALGEPALRVRAVDERHRYDREAAGSTKFKKGTRIYLEPTVLGKNQEVFSRFRQPGRGDWKQSDRPPKVVITGPDGKQVLSSTMEYG